MNGERSELAVTCSCSREKFGLSLATVVKETAYSPFHSTVFLRIVLSDFVRI